MCRKKSMEVHKEGLVLLLLSLRSGLLVMLSNMWACTVGTENLLNWIKPEQ